VRQNGTEMYRPRGIEEKSHGMRRKFQAESGVAETQGPSTPEAQLPLRGMMLRLVRSG